MTVIDTVSWYLIITLPKTNGRNSTTNGQRPAAHPKENPHTTGITHRKCKRVSIGHDANSIPEQWCITRNYCSILTPGKRHRRTN